MQDAHNFNDAPALAGTTVRPYASATLNEHTLCPLLLSVWSHQTSANAVAEGARSVQDVEVTPKCVPKIMPEEVALKHGTRDGIMFGAPRGFGTLLRRWPPDQDGQL
jgi:hypothetical protein